MKKVLPFLLSLVLSHVVTKSSAQACAVSDVVVSNENVTGAVGDNPCTATFDVSFTIENNNGNKFIFLHAWLQSDYPDYFQCANGGNGTQTPPTQANLANAFVNIAIDNSQNNPTIITTYPPDPTVVINATGALERQVLQNGSARITIRGVQAAIPAACGTPLDIQANVWSTNTPQAQVVQCVSCNLGYASLGISGTANCAALTYAATVVNSSGNPFTGEYSVYADVNGDQQLTAADALVQAATDFSMAAGETRTITGSIPQNLGGFDLFFVITEPDGNALTATNTGLLISTECTILPVRFVSFTATRQNNSVVLKWETATEENNKGFYIERKNGEADWSVAQFIASKAENGNSTGLLSYTYTDVNTSASVTQYRLRQEDIDGKTKYSEIRSVWGSGEKGRTMVYPNPSVDGVVNIVFENATASRNVFITDANGRIIKQWNNITAGNLAVENLQGGLYLVRIVDNAGGTQTTEKVIVSKH